jgi:hypothetical protein
MVVVLLCKLQVIRLLCVLLQFLNIFRRVSKTFSWLGGMKQQDQEEKNLSNNINNLITTFPLGHVQHSRSFEALPR